MDTNIQNCGPVIKIIGVGGCGSLTVDRLTDKGLRHAQLISVDTDANDLRISRAGLKIQIGESVMRGTVAGSDPALGQKAAESSKTEISDAIGAADIVFVIAGMGGGTGTGAAPIVASAAKEKGKFVVGVGIAPFKFEGDARMRNAETGLTNLLKSVDILVPVPNEKLFKSVPNMPVADAFGLIDEIIVRTVKGICDLINPSSLIGFDYIDLVNVLRNKGCAHVGVGHGKGIRCVTEAVNGAAYSSMLDSSIEGAKSVLIKVVAGPSASISEIQDAVTLVREIVSPSANIVFGADIDRSLKDEMVITIIAADF